MIVPPLKGATRVFAAMGDVAYSVRRAFAERRAVHVWRNGAVQVCAATLVGDAAYPCGEWVEATRLVPPVVGYPDHLARLLQALETGLDFAGGLAPAIPPIEHHLLRLDAVVRMQ